MKRQKSRTLISRTFSRVRTRLTSFGSSRETQSPNPLIAPPASPARGPRAYRTVPQRSPTHDTIRAPKTSRALELDGAPPTVITVTERAPRRIDGSIVIPVTAELGLPQIAALNVKTSTWTVFGTHAQYAATAYINIDLDSRVHAESESTTSGPGYLYSLKVTTSMNGSAAIIKKYGDSVRKLLLPEEEQWTLVLHIGIKDTSLAAKLSTSFRSLGGRLKRVSNLDVINRWLHVLQEDTEPRSASSKADPVEAQVKITFKHSLLPSTTMLIEERTITIAMNADEVERANAELGDFNDEDEERLREMRVLGAPWL